jgi:hypothetical protein
MFSGSRARGSSSAQRVFRAETVEQLEQLLLGRAAVPLAVAAEQFQQGLERQCKVIARLMVVGVRLQPGFQLGFLAGVLGLLGQFNGGPCSGDGGIAGDFRRGHLQGLPGAFNIARAKQRQGQPAQRPGIGRVLAQHRREYLGGIGGGTRLQHFLGLGQRLVQPVIATHAGQLLDESGDLGGRLRAHEGIDRLAAGEGEDRRDRLDPQLGGDLLILVDIDLDQPDRATAGLNRLLQQRGKLLAGTAPGRPEVDDHRRLARGLDHVGHETGVGGIHHRGSAAGSRTSGCSVFGCSVSGGSVSGCCGGIAKLDHFRSSIVMHVFLSSRPRGST